jgi:hypothetical protein
MAVRDQLLPFEVARKLHAIACLSCRLLGPVCGANKRTQERLGASGSVVNVKTSQRMTDVIEEDLKTTGGSAALGEPRARYCGRPFEPHSLWRGRYVLAARSQSTQVGAPSRRPRCHLGNLAP